MVTALSCCYTHQNSVLMSRLLYHVFAQSAWPTPSYNTVPYPSLLGDLCIFCSVGVFQGLGFTGRRKIDPSLFSQAIKGLYVGIFYPNCLHPNYH